MMKKFICSYECKHYFGQIPVMAINKYEAKTEAAKIIPLGHHNKSAEVIRDCGNCKLKIKAI